MAKSNNVEKHFVKAVWDFDDDTGAVATLALKQTSNIPQYALVTDVCLDTTVVNASAGANTLQVAVGATAITAAIAIGDRNNVADPPITALSAPIKVPTAGGDEIKVIMAGAAATAGRCTITVGYILSDQGMQ